MYFVTTAVLIQNLSNLRTNVKILTSENREHFENIKRYIPLARSSSPNNLTFHLILARTELIMAFVVNANA